MYLSNRKISYILREKIIRKEMKSNGNKEGIRDSNSWQSWQKDGLGWGGVQLANWKEKKEEGIALANWDE